MSCGPKLTRREWGCGLIFATGLLASGCATISPREESALGREAAEEFERVTGLVRAPRIVDYVRRVGDRLVGGAQRRDVAWQFNVADEAEANAFALPGGWVYVTRGLLALLNSEDELAGVLGHEMAHVLERHAVRRVEAATPMTILFGVPAALLGAVSPTVGGLVGGTGRLVSTLALASYNRDQEREADDEGMALAARAGWDPAGLGSFLHTLERTEVLAGKDPNRPRFFSTHPSAPERVARIRTAAGTLPRADVAALAPGRGAFVGRLEGLIVGDNPAHGVFVDSRFVHPELDIAIDMPAGWKTAKSAELAGAVAALDADAAVIVHAVTTGDDPVAGARADGLSDAQLKRLQRAQISSLPAARMRADSRDGERLSLTWVAHRNRIVRVTGVAPIKVWDRYAPMLERATQSFRALRPADRERVMHSRLQVRRARPGETVAAVLARGGAMWSAAEAAVANGTTVEARLEADWPVKIPVTERYIAGTA